MNFAGEARLVAEDYFDRLRFLYYVKIGEDVSALIHDEAGAGAFHRNGIHKEIVLRGFGQHVGDGWSRLAVNAHVDGMAVSERRVAFCEVGRQARGLRLTKGPGPYADRLASAPAVLPPK